MCAHALDCGELKVYNVIYCIVRVLVHIPKDSMTIALSLFSSILALAYFVYRKWHAASICYGFALAMLIALIPFTTTPPSYLYDLFGEEFCLDLH